MQRDTQVFNIIQKELDRLERKAEHFSNLYDDAAMPFMHPGRVEAIGAGALVWREVVLAVADAVASSGGALTEVVTSEHDILDGIALSIAG